MKRYRLYLDESGDHTYSLCSDPDARYLSLMGVLVEQEYYRSTFHPNFDHLKQEHFPHNPDDPLVLVRRQIIARKGLFGVLRDHGSNDKWEKALIRFFGGMNAILFAVVIDKQTHLAQYGQSAYHPYHYCLTILLERLRGCLKFLGGCADVMAESRGKNEDAELETAYQFVWKHGTRYISASEFQKILTSRGLKMRKKEANIAGLQVADLLAAPSKKEIILNNSRPLANHPTRFTREISARVRSKFNPYGRIFLG
jgi:hypothetical protein